MLTKTDLLQIKEVVKSEITPLKQDVSGLKKGQASIVKDVSGLKKGQASIVKDVSGLKKGQRKISKQIDTIINHFDVIESDYDKRTTRIERYLDLPTPLH